MAPQGKELAALSGNVNGNALDHRCSPEIAHENTVGADSCGLGAQLAGNRGDAGRLDPRPRPEAAVGEDGDLFVARRQAVVEENVIWTDGRPRNTRDLRLSSRATCKNGENDEREEES